MSTESEVFFLGLVWNCADEDAGVYCPFYEDLPNCPVACDVKYIDDGWDALVECKKRAKAKRHIDNLVAKARK